MPTSKDSAVEGELMEKPATLSHRRDECSLDDAYIFNYTQNPKAGKSAALRDAGFQGEHVRQEAYRMHNRLRLKIQAVTAENMRDVGSLSLNQLEGILKSNLEQTGTANMLHAIKMGIDFSKTAPKSLENMPVLVNPDDRRRRIQQLQQQISEKTGKPKQLPAPE